MLFSRRNFSAKVRRLALIRSLARVWMMLFRSTMSSWISGFCSLPEQFPIVSYTSENVCRCENVIKYGEHRIWYGFPKKNESLQKWPLTRMQHMTSTATILRQICKPLARDLKDWQDSGPDKEKGVQTRLCVKICRLERLASIWSK